MTERRSDDPTLLLHAALDGELDAAGAMEVEARLAADPALAAEYARLVALRNAIRTRLPRERAPDALRARVIAMAQTPEPGCADGAASLLAARRALSSARGVADARGRCWAPAATGCFARPPADDDVQRAHRRRLHQRAPFRPVRRYRDIGSPYRQTLVRRQDRGRDDRRRSEGGRLPPGGRPHRRGRKNAGSRPSSISAASTRSL